MLKIYFSFITFLIIMNIQYNHHTHDNLEYPNHVFQVQAFRRAENEMIRWELQVFSENVLDPTEHLLKVWKDKSSVQLTLEQEAYKVRAIYKSKHRRAISVALLLPPFS